MITVSVAGGSQPEILALVKEAHARHENQLKFVVFDTKDNIADETVWEYVQCEDEQEIVKKAVTLVAEGGAQILLKGIIQTHTLLKELLKKEYDLKEKSILSHVAMVDIPATGQSFLLTDCAMNIAPTEESLIKIVENAQGVANKIGLKQPKIALLSAAENFNPKMPSSVLGKAVTEHFAADETSKVFGPISLDLALSKDAVEHKRYEGPIMGDADIIVVPVIDAGNSLYKSLTIFGGAKVGGTIVGTKVPVVLTSRSDSTESKLHSLEFAMKQV
ncbi:phosphate acyltransferase [Vagococcus silagei]|uniref:Phosphotransacetylase n=1 Tax=Vagococcus silagei TaxID=2508885 RepID=A0A4V3TV22_9ENTE|nr:phosphate acyltransferase [Vagococcus silagei]THB61199.1 phosphotransacetylase [Vagococcus silagei]